MYVRHLQSAMSGCNGQKDKRIMVIMMIYIIGNDHKYSTHIICHKAVVMPTSSGANGIRVGTRSTGSSASSFISASEVSVVQNNAIQPVSVGSDKEIQ